MTIRLSPPTLREIEQHAEEAYPNECCGVVFGNGEGERVRRIENVQDRLHAEDPAAYPRDSRTAYFMEPGQLYAALREGELECSPIRLFYHSHPEHGAYFSDEDKARAMAWDEPAYPGACYLVLSVVAGKVVDRLAVRWDGDRREFLPAELAVG
jgi:[CysO sulfur-carrier protein]-S-L-cysteine hydrolase